MWGRLETVLDLTPKILKAIQSIRKITKVNGSQASCGLNHTLVLSLDGMVVWAFGDGDYGKLGTGSSTAKYYPQVKYTQVSVLRLFTYSYSS